MAHHRKWDDRWDAVMKREWGHIPARDLAERFGVRLNTLRDHAKRLGLITITEIKDAQQA